MIIGLLRKFLAPIPLIVFTLSQATADDLKFSWPLPVYAKVTSTTNKRGPKAVGTYDLSARALDDREILIEFSNFELVSINDRPASELQIPKDVKALMSSIPAFRVSRQTGQITSIVDFEEMMKKIVKFALDNVRDEEKKKSLSKFMNTPQYQNLIRAKSGEIWNMMAGFWAGREVVPGEPKSFSYRVPVGDIDVETRITYLVDDIPEQPGVRKLKLISEQVIPRALALNLLKKLLGGSTASKKIAGKLQSQLDDLVRLIKVTTVDSVHTKSFLLPKRITKIEKNIFQLKGEKLDSRQKISVLEFDWKRSR